MLHDEMHQAGVLSLALVFFITLKPRVERYTTSTSLEYKPAYEPLHIAVK